ncbi:LLM class flavin-dependent oxidoreductase [Serinibacter arcticus]|uniref:LLM class flavin-dependent oxidoreductase n=1 Tax=Serinibacter arcticus TaxID=1655435 RepID=A0A2U1ZXE9_9MICO|nr:LLM class flavin-dependent oxidoreductase [Serinibacter arcticus]PWD51667.1 LLM class flavin-dependent oxidoreductase [Serinibacter arcticus]
MRLSTVILPIHARAAAVAHWQRAEQLGFHTAYTYDHLSWRTFRDGPWFDALLTLAQAASVTSTLRLGTLVTTPNFRHPVTLAKDLMTLDDISDGRLTVGLGAGTDGFDAAVLGEPPLTPKRRADRFAELVTHLDLLLREGDVSVAGEFFTAFEARTIPGCVQRPRIPFAVAATGPRGLRLAARHGQSWVTTGDPTLEEDATAEQSRASIARQVARLEAACEADNRDPASIERVLLTGFLPDDAFRSVAAFEDVARAHAELGITEIVVHAPIPDTQFAMDEAVYEGIAGLAPSLADV